jgi:hypothetical protein
MAHVQPGGAWWYASPRWQLPVHSFGELGGGFNWEGVDRVDARPPVHGFSWEGVDRVGTRPPVLQSPSLRIIPPKNRLVGAERWIIVELGPGGEQSPEDWAGPPPAPRSTRHKVCVRRHSCDHQSWAGHPPVGHGPLDTKYASNIMDGRHSCDHQSCAGPPPDGHGPLDTKYAFNIMDGQQSCDHQSWAGPPPDGHGPLDTKYAFNMMDG